MLSRIKLLVFSLVPSGLLVLLLEAGFRIAGYDFADPTQQLARTPLYFRAPTVLVGEAFYRRPGPQSWTGRVISEEIERRGAVDDLAQYADEPILTVRYDGDGFRNPSLEDWEVAVVGDSFVEQGNLPDEDLFTSLLARRLGVRVRNLGVAKVGPLTYLAYLEAFGAAPSARHAVMAFYEGNDLQDLVDEQHRLVAVRAGEIPREHPLLTRQPQTSLLRAALRALPLTPRPRSTRNAVYLGPDGARIPITVHKAPHPGAEHDPEQRALLTDLLRRWRQSARALGMQPWLLYIPCKLRIVYGQVELDPELDESLRLWSPTGLPEAVEEIAEAHGIGFIDPTPCLVAATRAGALPYYALFDSHFNRRGSDCAADALVAALGPHREHPP